jgi:hypothetical protein
MNSENGESLLKDVETNAATVVQSNAPDGGNGVTTMAKEKSNGVPSATAEKCKVTANGNDGSIPFGDGLKNVDGTYDVEKVMAALQREHGECVRLRETVGKMADQKKESYEIGDLLPNLEEVYSARNVPDDEKKIMANMVKKFSDMGISQKQTMEVFKELKNYVRSDEDVSLEKEKFYDSEMAKLGNDKDTILASLRNFSDTMVANKVWDDSKKQSFYSMITTADVAKMMSDAIGNINVLRAGNFSNASQSPSPQQQFSKDDQVNMYRKAFELAKSNQLDGEMEVKRLDKLFGIR